MLHFKVHSLTEFNPQEILMTEMYFPLYYQWVSIIQQQKSLLGQK